VVCILTKRDARGTVAVKMLQCGFANAALQMQLHFGISASVTSRLGKTASAYSVSQISMNGPTRL
jgi:hypothetical protein